MQSALWLKSARTSSANCSSIREDSFSESSKILRQLTEDDGVSNDFAAGLGADLALKRPHLVAGNTHLFRGHVGLRGRGNPANASQNGDAFLVAHTEIVLRNDAHHCLVGAKRGDHIVRRVLVCGLRACNDHEARLTDDDVREVGQDHRRLAAGTEVCWDVRAGGVGIASQQSVVEFWISFRTIRAAQVLQI